MPRLDVMDRVKIIKAPRSDRQLIGKMGTILMIADDTKCIVRLDDGNGASVTIDQLEKIS